MCTISNLYNIQFLTFTVGPIQEYTIILDTDALVPEYWRFDSLINVSSYEVLVDGVSRPEFQNLIPLNDLQGSTVVIRYVLTDVLAGDQVQEELRAISLAKA